MGIENIPFSVHVMPFNRFPGEGKYVQLLQIKCVGVIYIMHAEQLAGNVFHIKIDGAGDESKIWETVVANEPEYLTYKAQLLAIGATKIITDQLMERHREGFRMSREMLALAVGEALGDAEPIDQQEYHHVAPQLGMYHESNYRADLPGDRDVIIQVRVREHVTTERTDS